MNVLQLIRPVAQQVGIPYHRIYANTIKFDQSTPEGHYVGYDNLEPTCRDGGKARVVQLLKDIHGYDKIIMIGDGVTDMQARPPADLFIGYGGVITREKVKEEADWFVTDFQVFHISYYRICMYYALLSTCNVYLCTVRIYVYSINVCICIYCVYRIY